MEKMQNKQFIPLMKFLCPENCCFCCLDLLIFVLLVGFYLFCIFVLQKLFLKKSLFWLCPDSLIYYTTDVHPLKTPIENYFPLI